MTGWANPNTPPDPPPDVTNPLTIGVQEAERTDNQYFTTRNGQGYRLLGRNAPTEALDGTTQSITAPVGMGSAIDIVADISDRFGTTDGGYRLGVNSVWFRATGRASGATTGDINAFRFQGEFLNSGGGTHDYNAFRSFLLTRTVYENDRFSNSQLMGPYWHIVTNTSATATEGDQIVDAENNPDQGVHPDRPRFWSTRVQTGNPWNSPAGVPLATSNANAAFPDDVYDVVVTAFDLALNMGQRQEAVVLHNWTRTIRTSQPLYTPNDNIVAHSGEGYRANRPALPLYVRNAAPTEGMNLAIGPTLQGTTTTNADGNAQLHNFNQPLAAGRYWLIADYDENGIFTPRLDAVFQFNVRAVGAAAAPAAQGNVIAALEGKAFSGLVATFTDDAPEPESNYSAIINWGDSTPTSSGTIVLNGTTFEVSGNHTYSRFGNYTVSVTITKTSTGGSDIASSIANVADAMLSASPAADLTATKGQTLNVTLATVTDNNPSGLGSDLSATIDWGDGSTSTGTIGGSAGTGFTVSGSHIYARGGAYPIYVATNSTGGSKAPTTVKVFVQDNSIAASGVTVNPVAGQPFTGVVASFTDSDADDPANPYQAAIHWGDGNISTGTVAPNGSGGYNVAGTNTYAQTGTYAITVYIIDTDKSTGTANSTGVVGSGSGAWNGLGPDHAEETNAPAFVLPISNLSGPPPQNVRDDTGNYQSLCEAPDTFAQLINGTAVSVSRLNQTINDARRGEMDTIGACFELFANDLAEFDAILL